MRQLSIFLLLCGRLLNAQEPADRSYLTLMVIPYTGPGESVRTTIDKSAVCRAVLGQVNNVFEERGYRTKDYMEVLRLPNTAPDATDIERTEIKEAIRNAPADVVVYVEITPLDLNEGDRQLRLRLQAVDKYSGENYANSSSVESTIRRYRDFVQPAQDFQMINRLKTYADQLDRKFADVLKNGRSVFVRLAVDPGSPLTLSAPVDGNRLSLSEILYDWIKNHSLRTYPGSGDAGLLELECKIPLVDAHQRLVTPYTFRTELMTYLRQLRISTKKLDLTDASINARIQIVLKGTTDRE